MEECVRDVCDHLREYKAPDLVDQDAEACFCRRAGQKELSAASPQLPLQNAPASARTGFHTVLARCRKRIDGIAIDRTRLRPIVKIIGEFWAQTTEGSSNYQMFDFLEKEGAQVQPEAIGTWINYLLAHARMQMYRSVAWIQNAENPDRWSLRQRCRNEMGFQKKRAMLAFGEQLYSQALPSSDPVAWRNGAFTGLAGSTCHLADPFYNPWLAAARVISRWARTFITIITNSAIWS